MRRRLPVLLALCVAVIAAPARASPDEAREWLQRMTDSLASRNYDGLFTHTAGNQSETMRIVHRVEDGRSIERLVSLDGSGREIVRTAGEVHFYMPDRRVVVVEPRNDGGSLLKALPAPGPRLDALYRLSIRDGDRLLGRDVRVLDVLPRDGYRYGYRLWLDAASAMPLRSVVMDRQGRVVERIHFTRLVTDHAVEAQDLEPAVDASGFQWLRRSQRPEPAMAVVGWHAVRVPPGFRLVASRLQPMPGLPMPIQHLIFSDGFASVSVFIEPVSSAGPASPESTSMGAANAFSTRVQGHLVTAVGEVPAETVRDFATSVAPMESGAAAPDQPPVEAQPVDAGQ